MAFYCRDVFLCLVIVVVCFTLPQARVNSMEISSTDITNITISNKESETEKHFDIENATRADVSELSRRNDDTDIDETEKKPKAKQDPYTKKLLETLNRMRENPQGFNMKEFLEAVNKTNELRKSAATTSTSKPEEIDKSHDDDGTDEEKTSTTTAVIDHEHDHEDTDEEKSSTTMETTDDEHHHDDTDEEKTSTTTETTDDEHHHEDTDEEKTSTTTEMTGDEHDHDDTDEGTTSTTTEATDDDHHHDDTDEGTTSTTTTGKPNTKGEYDYGGDGSSNCTCKTSLGVCYPIGARQCLFNNGAKVVRCDISGKWTFFKACSKSCEWKGGNIAECIN